MIVISFIHVGNCQKLQGKCGIYIYIYIQWTYLQTKKNEIMRFLGKWIELENIILS